MTHRVAVNYGTPGSDSCCVNGWYRPLKIDEGFKVAVKESKLKGLLMGSTSWCASIPQVRYECYLSMQRDFEQLIVQVVATGTCIGYHVDSSGEDAEG